MTRPLPSTWVCGLIAVLALSGTAFVSANTAPPPLSSGPVGEQATPAIVPIPVPEIAERAAEVTTLLRQSDARLADQRLQDVENRLPEASGWIRVQLVGTTQVLLSSPPSSALDTLTDSWVLMRSTLAVWNQALTRLAIELERQLSQLDALRATWSASRAEVSMSPAVPAPVLDRIDATLAAIVLARDKVENQRAHVLLVQDRVGKEIAQCDEVLNSIARARDELAGPVLIRDSDPIWRPGAGAFALSALGRPLKQSLGDHFELARQYVAGQVARVLLQVALFGITLVVLVRARARARARAASEHRESPLADVFNTPISAALVLTLVATAWIYPHPPRPVMNGVGLLSLVPVVVIARHLAPPELFPAVYALASFFLVDRVRDLCAEVPVLEQRVFLVEMIFGIAFLMLALRSERLLTAASGRPASGTRRSLVWILRGDMAVLAGAVSAGALGYMRLARLMGTLVLTSSYVALVLWAAVRIGDGLSTYVLRARPSLKLLMVQRHQQLLQRRVSLTLGWLAFGTWVYFVLDGLGMGVAIGSALATILNWRYARGSISLSLGDVAAFGLTVCAAFLLSSFARFVLSEEIYPRTRLAQGQSYALSTLLHYAVILVGFLFAVFALGVDLTRVTILAGAFGVGIGIGLQNVVANFVAGVLLLLEQRIHVGDSIETGDLQGEVREIGFRASIIRTGSGAEVIVPNSRLTSEGVTNWTLSEPRYRVDVDVRVKHSADTAQVVDLLRKTAEADARVLAEPGPLVVCTGFRDGGLEFELRAWTTRFEEADVVRSELVLAVNAALAAAGIDIALPPRLGPGD